MPDTIHKPNTKDRESWLTLASLAQKIGHGQSRAYGSLAIRTTATDHAAVVGVLNDENPFIRLRKLCAKAAYAVNPENYHPSMRELAAKVIADLTDDDGVPA
jgi:hypothetical protein